MTNIIHIATITSAHGIRGEIKVRSLTENPRDFLNYGALQSQDGSRSFTLQVTGVAKDQLIARIDGVNDRNAAEALKGVKLYAIAGALPPAEKDEYYLHQLVGLAVQDAAGAPLGEIKAVYNFGAGDIIEIAFQDGKVEMYPLHPAVFPEIAPGKHAVFVPPEIL